MGRIFLGLQHKTQFDKLIERIAFRRPGSPRRQNGGLVSQLNPRPVEKPTHVKFFVVADLKGGLLEPQQ